MVSGNGRQGTPGPSFGDVVLKQQTVRSVGDSRRKKCDTVRDRMRYPNRCTDGIVFFREGVLS